MVNLTWMNGTSAAGGVRSNVMQLALLLGNETIRRGYHPRAGWCWGFSCRAIGGTSSPSLHSWGLAIDINAPHNPRGTTLVTDMPTWMPDLWNTYGWRWGGDYPAPIQKDAMHYEFMGTPAQAAAQTVLARSALTPRADPVSAPTDGDSMLITHKAADGTESFWLVSGGTMASVSQVDQVSWTGPRITVTGDKGWAGIVARFG